MAKGGSGTTAYPNLMSWARLWLSLSRPVEYFPERMPAIPTLVYLCLYVCKVRIENLIISLILLASASDKELSHGFGKTFQLQTISFSKRSCCSTPYVCLCALR